MFKLDDALVVDYLAESCEQLETVEADLLAIEEQGAKIDEERVNRVFRAVHSVKGGAGFFNLQKIGELAHHAEDVLALIRSRKLVPTRDGVRILLNTIDRLNEMLRSPATSDQADIAGLTADLAAIFAKHRTPLQSNNAASALSVPSGAARLRVLLVEDDFACRLLLQSFLSRYGECHIAVNGREAVDAFRSALDANQAYDLICMDIMMPEMDGREAVRQVRALEDSRGIRSTRGVKIIMTTTVDEVKEVFLCFRELCDAYLIKPIDLGQLLSQMKFYKLVE
jgi:two-component system, chemotaxis family, chemotaxis protein CheY